MDPIERNRILTSLGQHGYALLSKEELADDAVQLLCEVLNKSESRLLEGFPVVLASELLNNQAFGQKQLYLIDELLGDYALQKRYALLAGLTFHLMKYLPDADVQRAVLKKFLNHINSSILSETMQLLQSGKQINVGDVRLSPDRLETIFRNYVVSRYVQANQDLSKIVEEKRTTAFNAAMNELFADRQRAILQKVIHGERLSKSEREYYSRTIKKRLKAIMNKDLQALAETLVAS